MFDTLTRDQVKVLQDICVEVGREEDDIAELKELEFQIKLIENGSTRTIGSGLFTTTPVADFVSGVERAFSTSLTQDDLMELIGVDMPRIMASVLYKKGVKALPRSNW